MGDRLYYTDSYLLTFAAHIEALRETERGPAVCLDQSAFYPTSGGQPHDTGFLNDVPVLDVWEDEEGAVWHLLAAPLPVGSAVSGRIDAARRADHRQQHTGQHLLSAAFLRLYAAPTVSFHMGHELSTIDIERASLSWEEAFAVEDEVNRVIWENRAVTVHLVAPEDVGRFHLRRLPQVTGTVRIIEVADYDANPCGGTHVRQTGEIGLLKIVGLERYKGGMRVSFVCGGRALRAYRQTLQRIQQVSLALTVGQEEVPAAVARLQEEAKTLRRELGQARETLLTYEADALWEATPASEGRKLIRAYWPERSFDDARFIAGRLRQRPRTCILLACGPAHDAKFICSRSDDWDGLNAGALLRALLGELGGKGGGSPQVAQGGASVPDAARIAEALARFTV